jgi:hypothetical protein
MYAEGRGRTGNAAKYLTIGKRKKGYTITITDDNDFLHFFGGYRKDNAGRDCMGILCILSEEALSVNGELAVGFYN